MRARNIFNLILISLCLLFAGVSLSLMSPFYPNEALSKGVSVTSSGIVIGSVFITTVIFTPLCGKYIDLLGGRRFMLAGSFICALGNIIFGFLDQVEDGTAFLWSSLAVRVIVAIGESAMTPSCYALASQQVSKENQGKALSVAEACFGVGTMFGPSVGGFLYEVGGFSLPFWVSGGVLLLVCLVSWQCLEDKTDVYDSLDKAQKVTWGQVFRSPGVLVSSFGLIFAGTSWSWYSATLQPFLGTKYGISPGQAGLIFTVFGATYTLFTPVFGYFSDKGLDGFTSLILGNTLIMLGFVFLGPIPQLSAISGNLWLTVVSMSVQGLGSAATYLGSLLFMMKAVKEAGLPDSEQVKSMVSSIWIVADNLGGYAGSTLGGYAYDSIGFEAGTLIEVGALGSTVIVMLILFFSAAIYTNSTHQVKVDETEERTRLVHPSLTDERIYGS